MTLYFGDLVPHLPVLLQALWVSVYITAIAMVVGGSFGVLLYLGKASSKRMISVFCASYIEIFRNTPVLVQLYIIYFGLPQIGLNLDPIPAVIVGLTLNNTAYTAEIYRGGFESVPSGQWEAGSALGMNRAVIFREIVFIQAIKAVFPALTNQLILLFLATSIASIIGAPELMTSILNINSSTYRTIEIFAVGGLMYYLASLTMAATARAFEQRLFRWGKVSHA